MQVPNTGIPPSKSITWGTVAVLEVDAVNDVITDDYIQELCLSLEKDSMGRSGTGNHGSGGAGGQSGIANASIILEAIQSASRNMVDPKTGQVTKESIDQSWKNFKNDIRAGISGISRGAWSDDRLKRIWAGLVMPLRYEWKVETVVVHNTTQQQKQSQAPTATQTPQTATPPPEQPPQQTQQTQQTQQQQTQQVHQPQHVSLTLNPAQVQELVDFHETCGCANCTAQTITVQKLPDPAFTNTITAYRRNRFAGIRESVWKQYHPKQEQLAGNPQ